ncbi:hypothetical protein SAMN05216215_101069 [Saccharopolyspora shandongensis]|uniref:Uncharacterized protein n=1 Tax=Saccharopolyspora shandongensis TaxID=418495 RepID=A0A1H3B5F0_9PSEU|nr:hypothetical protein SAMN05216215_101069 [Saccharopolyspora shandongensis]
MHDRGAVSVVEFEVDETGPSLRFVTFRREFTKSDGSSEENPSVEVPF